MSLKFERQQKINTVEVSHIFRVPPLFLLEIHYRNKKTPATKREQPATKLADWLKNGPNHVGQFFSQERT